MPSQYELLFLKMNKWKLSFLDVEMPQKGNKFVTTVYHKHIVSGVYTHFDSFPPTTYKCGMIYTLTFGCFEYIPTALTFIMS